MSVFLLVAVLFIALGIPLVLKRIPRNSIYGVRVQRTLKDEKCWQEINALAGKHLIADGLVLLLLIAGISARAPSISETVQIGILATTTGLLVILLSIHIHYVLRNYK